MSGFELYPADYDKIEREAAEALNAAIQGKIDERSEKHNLLQSYANYYGLNHPLNRFTFVMALVAFIREPLHLWYDEGWLFWLGLAIGGTVALFL